MKRGLKPTDVLSSLRHAKVSSPRPRKIRTLSLSEEDRRFISERDRRQERAAQSEKVLVGPLQPERE